MSNRAPWKQDVLHSVDGAGRFIGGACASGEVKAADALPDEATASRDAGDSEAALISLDGVSSRTINKTQLGRLGNQVRLREAATAGSNDGGEERVLRRTVGHREQVSHRVSSRSVTTQLSQAAFADAGDLGGHAFLRMD